MSSTQTEQFSWYSSSGCIPMNTRENWNIPPNFTRTTNFTESPPFRGPCHGCKVVQ